MAAALPLSRVAVVAVSLVLLWRVIQVNGVEYEGTGLPRLADASPAALLDDNPAEIGALLALARQRDEAGDTAGASKTYRVALDLAPMGRDVQALASAHFVRGGDPAGLELMGRLVTDYPDTRTQAFPVLAALLASDRFRGDFAKVASRNPAWLGHFLTDACARGMDPKLLAPLVLAASSPPPAAAGCVMDRLRGEGRWEESHHLWLNLLPKERRAQVGFVFNGGFETAPTGLGFDWRLQPAPEKHAGHTAEVVRRLGVEGERALRVAYNGHRQHGFPVRQFLLLPPGEYELTGRAKLEAIKAARGIQWTVRCVERDRTGAVVAASERLTGSADWHLFTMTVPIDGACGGHVLQLEPVGELGAVAFVSGTAWIDDLRLRRR